MMVTAFPTLSFKDAFFDKDNGEQTPGIFQQNYPDRNISFHFRGANAIYHGLKRMALPPTTTVLMPAFHCGVEIDAVIRDTLNIKYYRLDERLRPDLEHVTSLLDESVKVFFIIHYFGFPQPVSVIKKFCDERQLILLEDCAHALYSSDGSHLLGSAGDIAIFSLQKTLPVTDGGVLIEKKSTIPVTFEKKLDSVSLRRSKFLFWMNRLKLRKPFFYKFLNAVFFLPARWLFRVFKKSPLRNNQPIAAASTHDLVEELLDFGISDFSQNVFNQQNTQQIVTARRKHYQMISEGLQQRELSEYAVFERLPEGVCPLFFPLKHPKREALREKLAGKGIETFIFGKHPHASLPKNDFKFERSCADEILCLPVHQDLTDQHMQYVIGHVKNILRELSS